MPRYSDTVTLPDGTRAIVCLSGPRLKPCRVCGKRSTLLCDWSELGRACNAPLCKACAISPRPGVDYCPEHRSPEHIA
jgi:hypothetical protein